MKKNQNIIKNWISHWKRFCSFWPDMILKFIKISLFLFFAGTFNLSAININSHSQINIKFQEREIKGTVSDRSGNPLPGVNIIVKGTTTGTISDVDGNYAFTIPSDAQTLVFSFIGMQTQEVEIGSGDVYDITLLESAVDLSEVVVVGYGTSVRSDLTGSVSRVEGENIKTMAPTQITETLSGTVAGLYSQQSTSAAGGGTMEIRGPASLTADTDPLIVLDGVIYHGSLRDINPADIQSIDILRDASSAAVFGSKAAAGVILITTNRGEIGKPIISFSSKVGVATTTNDFYPYGLGPEGPEAYLNMHRDYFRQISPHLPEYYYFNPDDLPGNISVDDWMNYSANPAANPLDEWMNRISLWPVEIDNYKAGQTTNFYDLCIGTGIRQDYSLSVGGATEAAQYYWSIGYLDNEGIIKGDEFSTIRTRINFDLKVTDWLNVGTNSQFAYRDESVVEANLSYLAGQSPYGSMWNEDGSLRWRPGDYAYNPLMYYYGQDRYRKISSLFSSLYADLSLPYGFSFRVSFQPRFGYTKDYNYYSTNTLMGSSTYTGGYGRRDDSSSYGWMLDNLLKWYKEIGVHKFDVTLLANAEQSKSWSGRMENSTFAPNEKLGYGALQFGSKPQVSNSDAESSGDALMARLNYTLMDKYLITASIRRDGYSAFGQENPRANFPAFAFAWKIDEEPFYNSNFMNRLKLRLSWGINGNREIGAYSALARLGSLLGYDGSGVESGVYNTTLANPGLRWEKTEAYNIGLDLGFFENRLDISIDAYDMTTTDLLLNRQLPAITGFSSIMSNLGQLGNRGFEITLNSVNLNTKNFSWRSNLVFSINRNKIKELWGDFGEYRLLGEDHYGELPDFTNEWFVGQSRDVIWNYDVIGVWQLGEEEQASSYGLQPGDYKAVDVDDDGDYLQLEDKKFIGYTAPQHRWGLKNDFTFLKNFTASLFIRADLGHLRIVPGNTSNKSEHGRRNDWGWGYWSPENPTNEWQRYDFPDNIDQFSGGIQIYKPSGFLRVQDLILSYNVPLPVIQRVNINSLQVFGNFRNLFTITNWPGFDPESGTTPMPKTFTFGVNLSL